MFIFNSRGALTDSLLATAHAVGGRAVSWRNVKRDVHINLKFAERRDCQFLVATSPELIETILA